MEESKDKIIELMNQLVSKNTPLDAHSALQEIIEEAQNLQDECLRMEYAFNGGFEDEE